MSSLPVIVPTTRSVLWIGRFGPHFLAAFQRRFAQVEQHPHVERLFNPVILRNLAVTAHVRRHFRLIQNLREIQPVRLPVIDGFLRLESLSVRPIISLIVRKPSCAISSRTSCAMNRMKLTT